MNRNEGDKIKFDQGAGLGIQTGTIVGVANGAHAVIGVNWIVKLDKPIDTWPYSCITVFEVQIQK